MTNQNSFLSLLDIEEITTLHALVRESGNPVLNGVEFILAAELGRRVEQTDQDLAEAETKVKTLKKQAKVIKDAGF